MMRLVLALALVSALPANAYADGPCVAEADAVQRNSKRHGLDPSLANPTESAALAKMKEAKAHHQEGVKRASMVATRDQAGPEFRAAIDGYVAAALLSSAPLLLYNQAQVYRAAGDYPSAIEQYGLFLKRAKPRPPLRALIECQIGAMRAELERSASTAPPQGPAGGSDSPTTSKPPPASPDRPSLAATPPLPGASGLELAEQTTEPPPHTPWHSDPVAWGLTGGGIAVAGVGAYLLVDAHNLRNQANDEPRDNVRADLDARADSRQTWGAITTVAGAAILATGVVKLAITHDPPRGAHAHASLSIAPGGLVFGGQF